MIFNARKTVLANGKACLFRNPKLSEARELLDLRRQCASECEFLLQEASEWTLSEESYRRTLADLLLSRYQLSVVAEVDGKIVGCCRLIRQKYAKTKHRAGFFIEIVSDYTGMGIGSEMLRLLIETAAGSGVRQLELDVMEGNERAIALYRKMGFSEVSRLPGAFCLQSGEVRAKITMIRKC